MIYNINMSSSTPTRASTPRRSSIKTRLQALIIALVFLSTILVAIVAIRSIHQSYYALNQIVKTSLEDHYNTTVKDDVETITTILAAYTKDSKNKVLSPELQEQLKFIVRNAHYDKKNGTWDGYFFLYDLNGTVLAHGNDPMLEGKNLITMADPTGKLIIEKLRDAAKSGGGFVNYLWNKPTDVVGRYKKISYANMVPNTSWWLGTGIYVDSIDHTLAVILDKQKNALSMLLLKFGILTLAFIILSLLIAFYYGAKISRPIIALSRIAKNIANGDYSVRADVKNNDELGDMANSFNVMADSISEKVKDLIKKERYTARLLESIGDGIIVTDEQNKIVRVNPAAEKILEFDRSDLIGKDIALLIPEEMQGEYRKNVLDSVLQGQSFSNNVTRVKKDGSEIFLIANVAPVIEDDKSIHYRIHSFVDVTHEHKLKSQVKQMENLKKYFPMQIVEKLIEEGSTEISLAYDRKKVTIFFSDLVGFTDLSDTMEPEEIISILREYFTSMSNIVHRYSGTLDKFIGDSVMVFFGAPTSSGTKEDAISCIAMALEMQEKLVELNKKWSLATPVKMRIGINTGFVTVGNFGSEMRFEYTIMGTPVNIASRLEHQCEPGHVLISFETAQLVKDHFVLEEKEPVKLKGIHNLVKAFEVQGKS